MTTQERAVVGENWYGLAQMYGRDIPRTALKLMLDSVDDLSASAIVGALNHWAKASKQNRPPLPAEIRELVRPEEYISVEAQAREIAARICGAIPKYGWCNSNEARAFIGEIGWLAIERQGGWRYLCENMGIAIQPGTFQAQIRDQIAANIQYGPLAIESGVHALPSKEKDLVQLGELIKRLPREGIAERQPS